MRIPWSMSYSGNIIRLYFIIHISRTFICWLCRCLLEFPSFTPLGISIPMRSLLPLFQSALVASALVLVAGGNACDTYFTNPNMTCIKAYECGTGGSSITIYEDCPPGTELLTAIGYFSHYLTSRTFSHIVWQLEMKRAKKHVSRMHTNTLIMSMDLCSSVFHSLNQFEPNHWNSFFHFPRYKPIL